jgi:hypothetical protein
VFVLSTLGLPDRELAPTRPSSKDGRAASLGNKLLATSPGVFLATERRRMTLPWDAMEG